MDCTIFSGKKDIKTTLLSFSNETQAKKPSVLIPYKKYTRVHFTGFYTNMHRCRRENTNMWENIYTVGRRKVKTVPEKRENRNYLDSFWVFESENPVRVDQIQVNTFLLFLPILCDSFPSRVSKVSGHYREDVQTLPTDFSLQPDPEDRTE